MFCACQFLNQSFKLWQQIKYLSDKKDKCIILLLHMLGIMLFNTELFLPKWVCWQAVEKLLVFTSSLKSDNFLTDMDLIFFLSCAKNTKVFLVILTEVIFGTALNYRLWLKREGLSDENSTFFNSLSQNQFLPFLLCSCQVLEVSNLGENLCLLNLSFNFSLFALFNPSMFS